MREPGGEDHRQLSMNDWRFGTPLMIILDLKKLPWKMGFSDASNPSRWPSLVVTVQKHSKTIHDVPTWTFIQTLHSTQKPTARWQLVKKHELKTPTKTEPSKSQQTQKNKRTPHPSHPPKAKKKSFLSAKAEQRHSPGASEAATVCRATRGFSRAARSARSPVSVGVHTASLRVVAKGNSLWFRI